MAHEAFIMSSVDYLNKALQILSDRNSTKDAKLVARQILHNSGFTDEDIYECLKQGSTIRITIFEA
jgi:tartrate dehydratase alpha subunit/fumarate hydratase class I-like protein